MNDSPRKCLTMKPASIDTKRQEPIRRETFGVMPISPRFQSIFEDKESVEADEKSVKNDGQS